MSDPERKEPMSAGQSDPLSPPLHFTQRQLAERWQVSVRTLERWRAERYGPPWVTLGGSIRYRLGDIQAYEARHRHGGSGDA